MHATSRSRHFPRLTTNRFPLSSLLSLAIIIAGLTAGPDFNDVHRPLASRPPFPRRKEEEKKPSQARLSPEQATRLAINDLQAISVGYHLNHPRHLVDFTTEEVRVIARRSGLEWHWQLTYVGTKGTALPDLALAAVAPVQDAPGRVSYARGSGLIEQYYAQTGAVEQQFVITRPLALDGADLVIRGRVRCAGQFATIPQGWEWWQGKSAVSLGTVKVTDASGNDVPATMEVTAEHTQIVVTGTALARAAYPVTIDPEIGTNDFRISDMGPDGNADFDAFPPSVAYNPTNNEYLVVWYGEDNTGSLARGEFEIFGQRLNAATGEEVGANDFRISDMGPDGDANFDAFFPAVAYDSTNNEYLVVWQGDDDTDPLVDNEREIFGQRLNAATGEEVGANDFRISDMGPDGDADFGAFEPAVVYNPANNEYLVVWEGYDNTGLLVDDEYEIFGQRLNAATGEEVGANDFRISDMGPDGDENFDAYNPSVAYNSTNNEYLVVWYGDDNIALLVDGEREIFGQRLNAATGEEVGANDFRISDMGPNGDAKFGAAGQAVAYNPTNNEYLVVWQGDDNTSPLVDGEREIFGQRLNAATGAEVGAKDFRISDMGPNGDTEFDADKPAVAYNPTNNEYLVVWHGDDNTGLLVNDEFEIFGQRLNAATGAEVGTNDFRISDMGPDGNANFSALIPAVAYNSTNNEYLVVWRGDDNTAPLVAGEFEIFGQRLSGAAASLFASVLPNSRSVQVGTVASASATIINTGSVAVPGCTFAPVASLPALFHFRQTDCATNVPIGTQDAPITIGAFSSGCFLFSFQPTKPIPTTQVGFTFACLDSLPAPTFTGLNTLLLSASLTPVADVVPTVQTLCNDGIVNIPKKTGQGNFVVTTENLGSEDTLTVRADTGETELPLTLTLCKLIPATGQCRAAPGPKVKTKIGAGAKPKFAVFVEQTTPKKIGYDWAVNRIFVRFRDGSKAIRGLTSVAVRTHPQACGP